MADYGRHEDDTRTRNRNYERSDRDRGMFDYGRERERGREEERGFGGSSRFGRAEWHDRDRDRNRDRGRDRERGWSTRDLDDRERGRDRGERRYGSDDFNRGLPMDETSKLIASNKVEGTAVYGRDGDKLGSIYNFMVDKFSGKVRYAVLRYSSGFLGLGERYYPLPWKILDYDKKVGGYHIDMTEEDLEHAPSFDRNSEPQFDDDYDDRVHGWYGMRRR